MLVRQFLREVAARLQCVEEEHANLVLLGVEQLLLHVPGTGGEVGNRRELGSVSQACLCVHEAGNFLHLR